MGDRIEAREPRSELIVLATLSISVGAVVGIVVAVFRIALEWADGFRNTVLAWAHGEGLTGLVLILGVSACAGALGALLVRRFSPFAIGSGIPHVEAVLKEELPPAPFRLIPVKFFGGFLAIGTGFALGREGPSVQMGATIAHLLGTTCGRKGEDCRALLAAGAGAGLAVAFNAPIAGAVFVLEELVRRFDTRITITTLGASAGAIAMSRILLGQSPDFHVEPLPYLGFGTVPIHLVLGAIAGFLGIAYNRSILGALRVTGRPNRSAELYAALVGVMVALLAWMSPGLVGGGDPITQRALSGQDPVLAILGIFTIRFILGPISYAARTPGGLFAPMLVLGAQLGLVFGMTCCHFFPGTGAHPIADAVVGIAAFFTAVVRAPVTGIVLAIELTGSFTLFLPMLSACFTAMLIPTLFNERPIYDSLGTSLGK